jgi:hypothetical protein
VNASRLFAALAFWGSAAVTAIVVNAIAVYVVGYYDVKFGPHWCFQVGLALSIYPTTVGSIVYVLVVQIMWPITRQSAARLYFASSGLGIVTAVTSLVTPELLVSMFDSRSGPTIFVLAPLLTAGLFAFATLFGLVRLGWLRRTKLGHCPSCGYDLRGAASGGGCPECGWNRQPEATA